MKLEVGMYVRTDKGFITKIKKFEYHYTKGSRLVDSCSVKKVVENYLLLDGNQCEFIESIDYSIPPCYPSDEELEKIKSHIVRASFDIMDLIEIGDYVNGDKVNEVVINEFSSYVILEGIGHYVEDLETVEAKDIETIVTKEQFEQMSYKMKE